MRDIVKSIHIIEKDVSELTDEERRLIDEAKEATFRSYSPYSKFSVGAAALLDNGEIISGSNQENCATPSGICAERTTVFYANSRYPDKRLLKLCIAARNTQGEFTPYPITPCGSCRQVLLETEHRYGQPIEIILYGTEGVYFVASAADLLPVGFDNSKLN